MVNDKIRDVLNDGFVEYGKKETQRSEKGKRVGETFNLLGRLAYQEMSCRDEDYKMAQIMSATLDIKIKTLYPPNLRNTNKSKITIRKDCSDFDVIKVDTDREKMYLFFYLQEVGRIE